MKVWKHCGDSMSPMVQWHDTRRTKGVSLPLAIACMVEGEAKNSEHEDEPNQDAMQPTLDKNSKENVSQEGHLALLDTACTACMHSKAWREAYERSLPEDEKCIPTPHRKTFHFANGDSTENKVTVWKIPIYVGGFKGEVYSAEMPKGNTPLLLSIAAMTALDMVVFLRRKVVMVGKLNIELPLINTHTNHLAIDVAYDQKLGIQNASQVKIAEPRFVSEKEDLLVYYGEEAKVFLLEGLWMPEASYEEDRGGTPDHGLRGVRAQDERSFVATRRGNELEKASRRIRGEDRRTWVALRRSYSVAEELALRQFESTAIFEPFGGTFGVTRMAAEKFGWTNSQPLDLVDGYDLLKKAGRELVARTLEEHDPFLTVIAFDCRIWSLMCNMNHTIDWEALRSSVGRETIRLVRWICWHRHQRGRYYLVENPAGSAAWEFDRLREELREKAGGKFIISDQCRYGLKDSQSGRPIKKPTGWASNAEVLLNHLGKKCRCRWGEHEHLLGSNRDGPRAKRAASYPTGLCTAICQGALETMRLDYAIYMSGVNAAFPVEDEDEEMPLFDDREEGQPEQSSAEEDMARDAWRLNGNTLRRIHVVPRCRLFTPLRATDPPVEVEKIGPTRKTQMKKADGSVQIHEDLWAEPHPDFTETDYLWTGHTEFQLVEVEERRPDEEAEPVEEAAEKDEEVKRDRGLLKRRRARTRQLQRGLWVVEEDEAVKERLQATLELMDEQDVHNWMSLEKGSELFEAWASAESAQAEVQLILCSRKARRMRKPQPFAGPAEVPLRKGFLLLENSVLCTYWETWTQLAPQAQIRPLVAEGRQLYVVMFGKELGDHLEVEKDDRYMAKEQERMRRWNALPRELKLAVKRIHVNLGHANIPSMLRALRVSRASEVALRAVRLFRCEDCPRIQDPKQPRPSKLPLAEEFNVQIGMDVLQEKDSAGHTWSWLNILCQGTTFQVCVLLGDVHHNPSGKDILEAFLTGWTTWAGYPERGLVTDRAKPFLSEVAEDLAEHGCTFDSAAKAAPWQIGQIERHGGLWKGTFRRAAWSQQASGLDEVRQLTASVNHSKNTMCRKHGFSPSQWVLGKDLRLPADLADDSEVSRIGAQALADTPGTKFFRKTQLRMAAREAFARTANSEALRRAELRKVRPTRGPFLPGMYVWYYDQADRAPGPNNWRGVARVIGKEGQSTVWISHRGILLAVAPEHLSRAFDEEVRNWTVVAREHELIDATPAAGGTSFIDLRKAPAPGPAALPIQEAEDETREEVPEGDNGGDIFLEEAQEDLSASSTSMARMHLESEREEERAEVRRVLPEERGRKASAARGKEKEDRRRSAGYSCTG